MTMDLFDKNLHPDQEMDAGRIKRDMEELQIEVPDSCISGLLCILLAERRTLSGGEVQSFPERQGCWYLFSMLNGSLSMTHENQQILLKSGNAVIISGNSATSVWPSEGGDLIVFCLQGSIADEVIHENQNSSGLFFRKGAGVSFEAYGELAAIFRKGQPVRMTKASCLAYEILMRLYGTGSSSLAERASMPKVVVDALRILQKDFAFLEGISDLADRLDVSQEYLTRTFHKSVGLTPGKYLNQLKIEYAKMLFGQGGHTVTFVADACGFSSSNYFTRVFREATGMSPSEYMKHNRQSNMDDPMLDAFYVL